MTHRLWFCVAKKLLFFRGREKNERFLINYHPDYFNYPAYPAAEGDPAHPVISHPGHHLYPVK
jgi:hypothetical protein